MSEIKPVALVGTCKTCKFWDGYEPTWGTCKKTVWEEGKSNLLYDDSHIHIYAGAEYSYGIESREMDTSSNFACNQWEAK